jgi:hypothetical protein
VDNQDSQVAHRTIVTSERNPGNEKELGIRHAQHRSTAQRRNGVLFWEGGKWLRCRLGINNLRRYIIAIRLSTNAQALERNAILQALSIDIDSEVAAARSLTSAVIESLAAKFSKRPEERHAEFRRVNQLAESLRGRARRQIERAFTQLKDPVSFVGTPEIHLAEGGPDRGKRALV